MIIFCLSYCESIIFDEDINDPRYVYDAFWNELDRNFSFFTYRDLDWDFVYTETKSRITSNTTSSELYDIFNYIIQLLGDGHTNVYTPHGIAKSDIFASENMLRDITHYMETYIMLNSAFHYGIIKDSDIGYIRIRTFLISSNMGTEQYEKIDSILYKLDYCDAIVIDVRSNSGGHFVNTDLIASRFVDCKRFIYKKRRRNGPNQDDFSDWQEYFIEPYEGTRYLKPLAILTNRYSASATEQFVAKMDVLPQVTIIGDRTRGLSSNTRKEDLPNGWVMRISNEQTILPEGRDYQYSGLYPDIFQELTTQDYDEGRDTILEKATEILKK